MISSCCSAPDFVRTLEDETYVYFFFREQAVEYINCGKVGSSSPVIVMLYHNIFSYMDVYPQVFSIITIWKVKIVLLDPDSLCNRPFSWLFRFVTPGSQGCMVFLPWFSLYVNIINFRIIISFCCYSLFLSLCLSVTPCPPPFPRAIIELYQRQALSNALSLSLSLSHSLSPFFLSLSFGTSLSSRIPHHYVTSSNQINLSIYGS